MYFMSFQHTAKKKENCHHQNEEKREGKCLQNIIALAHSIENVRGNLLTKFEISTLLTFQLC